MSHIHILHLIYRFDIGGLEKVMSECINHLPESMEHTVVSLTNITQYAAENLNRPAKMIELNKKPGNDLSLYWKLYQLLRKIKPDVLQSYNLPTLEYQLIAFLAGVKIRVHAEHGRDISDPQGKNKKYNLLRRLVNPLIHHWVAVSNDLKQWLINEVRLPQKKIKLIYNGVDTDHFKPEDDKAKFNQIINIGTIGRFDPIKNQTILLDVIQKIKKQEPAIAEQLKISIIGDGPEFNSINKKIHDQGLNDYFCLPGVKYNIAEILQGFDIFVLPSIAEGVPMTLLEAMSMGLPSICTKVGGIPEVLTEQSGILVSAENCEELVNAIIYLLKNKKIAIQLGKNARKHVVKYYSIQSMVQKYQILYSN